MNVAYLLQHTPGVEVILHAACGKEMGVLCRWQALQGLSSETEQRPWQHPDMGHRVARRILTDLFDERFGQTEERAVLLDWWTQLFAKAFVRQRAEAIVRIESADILAWMVHTTYEECREAEPFYLTNDGILKGYSSRN